MRKIVLIFAIITAFGSYVNSQTTLSWRFANYEVVNAGTQLQFDVEVMANNATTYHRDLQVYFDYNTTGFGSSVATGITITPLSLMDMHYSIVNTADNTSSKIAIITEADNEMAELGGATYFNLMPNAFTGLFQVTMDITDNSTAAGISFDEALMNGGQYYQSTSAIEPVKYVDPCIYDNDLLTDILSTAYGNLTYANPASTPLQGFTVILEQGAVEIGSGITDAAGLYLVSGLSDGVYDINHSWTAPRGGTNILDVIRTKQFLGGGFAYSNLQQMAADVNNNGGTDILDVIFMQQQIGGFMNPGWSAPDFVFETQTVNISGGIGTTSYQSLSSGDPIPSLY